MNKLRGWVDKTATTAACLICATYMCIIIYNVGARYIFGGGIPWYMESSQYLNVWAMLIAGIGLCASNEHLRVSMIDEILKGKAKKIDRCIVAVLTLAFYLFFAYSAYLLATRSRQTISTMAPMKMAYVYWMLPVTSVLSALAMLLEFICYIRGNTGTEKGATHDHLSLD